MTHFSRDPLAGSPFHAVRRIRDGTQGVTYEAVNLQGRRKSVKVFARTSPTLSDRLRLAMCSLRSAGGAIYTVGELADGRVYLAAELLDGVDVGTLLEGEGALEPEEAVEMVLAVLTALAPLHRAGLTHGSLKPSNLLLQEPGQVVVLYPGVIRALDEAHAAQVLVPRADDTVRFLAPEQLGLATCDPRSDIFAVGLLLATLLTGERPYEALGTVGDVLLAQVERPHESHAGLPASLKPVVERATAPAPAARFESVEAFRATLEAWRDNKPRAATRESQRPFWTLVGLLAAITASVGLLLVDALPR